MRRVMMCLSYEDLVADAATLRPSTGLVYYMPMTTGSFQNCICASLQSITVFPHLGKSLGVRPRNDRPVAMKSDMPTIRAMRTSLSCNEQRCRVLAVTATSVVMRSNQCVVFRVLLEPCEQGAVAAQSKRVKTCGPGTTALPGACHPRTTLGRTWYHSWPIDRSPGIPR